jgi:hypothetical protein
LTLNEERTILSSLANKQVNEMATVDKIMAVVNTFESLDKSTMIQELLQDYLSEEQAQELLGRLTRTAGEYKTIEALHKV